MFTISLTHTKYHIFSYPSFFLFFHGNRITYRDSRTRAHRTGRNSSGSCGRVSAFSDLSIRARSSEQTKGYDLFFALFAKEGAASFGLIQVENFKTCVFF
uniref:(northern house mosquito) hypothetical protein n=1 Tax=Culex pipiens TaxID=7175 RepID=A0A8D8HXB3_CULPI